MDRSITYKRETRKGNGLYALDAGRELLMKRNVWFAGERPPGALTMRDFTLLGRSAISDDNPTDSHHVEAQKRDSTHVGPPPSKVWFDSGSTPFSQMQKLGFSYT